jgi:integrase
MARVSDNYHLLRRNGVYYYRRRVPDAAAPALGKSVIKFSLRTTDKKTAKRRRSAADLEWGVRFETAIAGAACTLRQNAVADHNAKPASEAAIEELIRDYVTTRTTGRAADVPMSEEDRQQMIENVLVEIGILKNADDLRADQFVYRAGRKILARNDATNYEAPISYPTFAELVRRALLEIARRKLGALEDDNRSTFFDQLFDPSRRPSVNFGQLSDQFLKLREEDASLNGVSRQHVDRLRAQVSLVRQIVGDATPVSAIDHDSCLNMRAMLARIPKNRTKFYGGLSLSKAIAAAEKDGRSALAALTQSQYLAVFRDILDLAAKKRLIPVNFAEGITPVKCDDVARGDKRHPFSLNQIADFFHSEYYQKCATNQPLPCGYDKNGWRFWLPLLCLFMGFRPNEVCQLDTADIKRTEAGVWYIDAIESDDDEAVPGHRKTLKTTTSRRRVPLHPEIEALGFLYFAKAQRAEGSRLFPSLKRNKYGNSAWYALKRFNETFLPKAIKIEERQSFYSFRHSFRDALRRAKADHDTMQALGWSQDKLVSDDYGERSHPDYLAAFMPSITFPGLDLSHVRAKVPPQRQNVKT